MDEDKVKAAMEESVVSAPARDPEEERAERLQQAFKDFDTAEEQSDDKVRMSWSDQCVRALLSAIHETSAAHRLIRDASPKGTVPSMDQLQELFGRLPTVLVLGEHRKSKGLLVSDLLKQGDDSKIMREYFSVVSHYDDIIVPAVFMQTCDVGPVVVHGLTQTLEARPGVSWVYIPADTGRPKHYILERRLTFAKLMAEIGFV